jgi:hypothetical protein
MSTSNVNQSAATIATDPTAEAGASNQSATGLKAARIIDLAEHMADAFSQLEHEQLREVLLESVDAEREWTDAIRASFETFTAKKHDLHKRRTFFASWQRTNNSAMSVEGLANRMTAEGENSLEKLGAAKSLSLFRAAGRLNRVTDEDLGVGGQVHHFELYYRMASQFCDEDDAWQSRAFCTDLASDFKSWLDASRLRDPIMTGLFSMLIHEGYTHAELEMIAPLFDNMATRAFGLPIKEAKRKLAWITVHNGGTEKRHFAHSCLALEHYCDATGAVIDLAAAGQMFRSYLRRKGAVMRQLEQML